MFDFIKNIFKGSNRRERAHADDSKRPNEMDVVENNNMEVLRTAEISEGFSAQALQGFAESDEIVHQPVDLPMTDSMPAMSELEVISASQDDSQDASADALPAAQLDEPTDEPGPEEIVLTDEQTFEEIAEPIEPDNFLSGDLSGPRMLRNIQAREAGVSHWNSSSAKYRPRQRKSAVDGTAARSFEYFEALQNDPQLRQMELEHPGMSMECLSLNKFLSDCMKSKMVGEYVDRSIESIHDQAEEGMPPLQTVARQRFGGGTSSGVTPQAEHRLRGMFDAFEIKQAELKKAKEAQIRESNKLYEKNQLNAETWDAQQPMDGNFEQVDALFEAQQENERDENYTRWLLSVAEEATESDDVLWLLVQDPNPDVRFCLAENYEINTEILHALSMDENPYVAHRAEKTLYRLSKQGGIVVDHDFSSAVFQQRKSS